MVLLWLIVNLIVAFVVQRAVKAYSFLTFIVSLVAVFNGVKFFFSTWFLIDRLFRAMSSRFSGGDTDNDRKSDMSKGGASIQEIGGNATATSTTELHEPLLDHRGSPSL